MPTPSDAPRQFAVHVVQKLRAAGYQSLWAGGCVRDDLLGRQPKDYDVATNATPEQIREVFGRRRTLAMGAAFGVMTILGHGEQGQIEVATFRNDGGYSDGRHPDAVTFSTAEEDAQRRDFTINGLFYDPLSDEVIDYVGGREDLQRGIVRAIGQPSERIGEDKLRMLRAVRFAATFEFDLDPTTLAAVQQHAPQIGVVSAERIAAEMRRMLVHPTREVAARLLAESGLLVEILPEAAVFFTTTEDAAWQRTLQILTKLQNPTFAVTLAALLREAGDVNLPRKRLLQTVVQRWKLTNDEARVAGRIFRDESLIRQANTLPWPQLQRLLVAPDTGDLLTYARAVANVVDGNETALDFCEAKLSLPPSQLDPPPLLTGDDLKKLGIPPGPSYASLLRAVRDAQLDGKIHTVEEATTLVHTLQG